MTEPLSADCLRPDSKPVVAVEGLRIATTSQGLDVVHDVSLEICHGEVVGLVGETGCGKTTLGLSLLGFVRPGLRFASGSVVVDGRDLLACDAATLRAIRGSTVSYVPQDAGTSLNPGLRLGQQFDELLAVHGVADHSKRRERVADVLTQVGLLGGREFLGRYPHQLSGGQQQRAAIAMSFACRPSVVVMDEPTTGLDVATQQRVLEAVDTLRRVDDAAVLMVSHDLSMLSRHAGRLAVMYAGTVVELASVADIGRGARHPYTFGLYEAIPDPMGNRALVGILGKSPAPQERAQGCTFAPRCSYTLPRCHASTPDLRPVAPGHLVRCMRAEEITLVPQKARTSQRRSSVHEEGESVLEGRGLVARYGQKVVLDDVSVAVAPKSCLAVVGESGSGKTTLARCLVGLHSEFEGEVRSHGQRLERKARSRSREMRRKIQYVFQNPYSSLNPRKSVLSIVALPLQVFFGMSHKAARVKVVESLERVGLGEEHVDRFPHELSGGERQRVALARALVAQPSVLICDEVTSSLDVSVQATIVNLLHDLQEDGGLSMLFITHNLPLVLSIAADVMVLRGGKVLEAGPTEDVFTRPSNPYTRSLLVGDSGSRAAGAMGILAHIREAGS